jgi:hypothetical protein
MKATPIFRAAQTGSMRDLDSDLLNSSPLRVGQDIVYGRYGTETPEDSDILYGLVDDIEEEATKNYHANYGACARLLDLMAKSKFLSSGTQGEAGFSRDRLRKKNPLAERFFCNPDINICLHNAASELVNPGDDALLHFAAHTFFAVRNQYLHTLKDSEPQFMTDVINFGQKLRRDDPPLYKEYKEQFTEFLAEFYKEIGIGVSRRRGFGLG